ncbi:MAG: chorismate synthase [Oscillospiraceae bacterium]
MRYTTFGESHGAVVGVLLTAVPPGLPVSEETFRADLRRRAGGDSPLTTSRREPDAVRILSGVYGGKTTGDPLCLVIENRDVRDGDYAALQQTPRPGHGDYAVHCRSGGCNDPRGGGHQSGRLTAPLVAAGCLAREQLSAHGIVIGAHLRQIGGAEDASFDQIPPTAALLDSLRAMDFPTLDAAAGEQMRREILQAAAAGDSVGGSVECAILGLPAGFGGGENLQSLLARHLLAIPGGKALGFGIGTDFASLRGSAANDPYRMENGRVVTETNHCGGLSGGLSTGMPVTVTLTFRPTPSIALPQRTVELETRTDTEITVTGRHDPCIALRALPVVEAVCGLALSEGFENLRETRRIP